MTLGVLLFNLGGPEKPGDVRPFLFNLFSDPEIVRLPWKPAQKPLAWLIATIRYRKSVGYYRQIGGGSPLRQITEAQASALGQELGRRGVDARIYVGMRYWPPFTVDALKEIERDGVSQLVVLPLYPQFSVSTTGSSFKEFVGLIDQRGGLRDLKRHYISRWNAHPGYVASLAEQIAEEINAFPNPDPGQVHLLFSAHSVPQSYISKGDPYLSQIQETVRLVTERLGNRSPVELSFQSKVGPVKWLEPSTDQKLRELAGKGVRQVLAIPISFVSDHIETLYELDILYRKLADQLGIETYRRVPALNCSPTFINTLADLVCDAVGNDSVD